MSLKCKIKIEEDPNRTTQNVLENDRAHAAITRLAPQPFPPLMVQDQPYYRQGFQYGFSTEHHLGAVNGLPLDYGIETRKPWGKQTGRRASW
jgi:hypothetical protein